MRNSLLVFFIVVLASCQYTPKTEDSKAILSLIKQRVVKAEICLKDNEFKFPDVIVGTKYSGNGLAQLDALVNAGLLSETVEQLGEPKYGPRYVYHYKQQHTIERKTFYLTDLGLKYYHKDNGTGYFCYGRPVHIQIDDISSDRNDQDGSLLNATFSYDVQINPDTTWISNPWIQREFSLALAEINRRTAQQKFIKDSQGLIKQSFSGILNTRFW